MRRNYRYCCCVYVDQSLSILTWMFWMFSSRRSLLLHMWQVLIEQLSCMIMIIYTDECDLKGDQWLVSELSIIWEGDDFSEDSFHLAMYSYKWHEALQIELEVILQTICAWRWHGPASVSLGDRPTSFVIDPPDCSLHLQESSYQGIRWWGQMRAV